ncbi:MAG: metallophosphoesterase [Tepidisphaerales bacterium]
MDAPKPSCRITGPFPWLQRAGDDRLRVVRVRLPVHPLPRELDGFTFVHLADVHLRKRWEPVLDRALAALRPLEPQLVLFTGDFVDDKLDHRPALPAVRRLLAELKTRLGTYAVTGNHDGPKLIGHLRHAPVTFINNRRVVVPRVPLELIGLGGWRARHARPEFFTRFPLNTPGLLRVVLCHYPFLVREAAFHLRPALYLTGHTHGGQVCLPGGIPVFTHDLLPRRFCAGLHDWSGTWMNVSRGLGFSHWQIRTFCPPELHVFTLVPGVADGPSG